LGNKIIYTDLFEISILRQPHASVIAIVGFVGILMGLKPTWKTVKGILLKEFSIFLNFVREVRSSLLLPFH
jgi:xanthosine utilization system XapX-like protein